MTTIRLYDVRVSLEHAALAQSTFNLPPSAPVGAPRRFALDGINLEIRHGETMGILGPSGCGKSTLLRAIAGLVPLSEGTITYDDQDMKDVLPGERGIGIVFQNYALYPNMTSYENVGFFLRLRKRDQEIPERVREVSRVMGIGFRACWINIPVSSPAASASAWRWRAASPATRKSSSSMSRSATSMPSCASRRATSSSA